MQKYHTIPYHTIPYHTIQYHTIPYHSNYIFPKYKITIKRLNRIAWNLRGTQLVPLVCAKSIVLAVGISLSNFIILLINYWVGVLVLLYYTAALLPVVAPYHQLRPPQDPPQMWTLRCRTRKQCKIFQKV